MGLYERLASTATSLISSKGVAVTFTRRTVGEYNVETSTSEITTEVIPARVTIFEYSDRELASGATMADGSRVQRGDRKVLMEPNVSKAPQLNDIISLLDGDYRILDVQKVAPAGTVVIYKLGVRV